MGVSVNSIPSVGVPFVLNNGLINPIWYEFFRSFIADTVEATAGNDAASIAVTAGAGLTGGGALTADITLTVGQGSGILINADDVAVDITNQTYVPATLDDEVLIADYSDTSRIKKTKIKDIAILGGIPGGSDTQLQYNNGGVFSGDTGSTTNGAGSVNITGDLDVDNINLNGNSIISTDTNGAINVTPNGTGETVIGSHVKLTGISKVLYWDSGSTGTYHIGADGGTPYIRGPDANHEIQVMNDGFEINTSSTRKLVFKDTEPGIKVEGAQGFYRSVTATITASTTQTQGNGQLTTDINEISVCANVNDTVTLPAALAGRHCLVINNGAQTAQVFPNIGDNLGAGVDTATTIVSGSRKLFIAYDSTNWEPVV